MTDDQFLRQAMLAGGKKVADPRDAEIKRLTDALGKASGELQAEQLINTKLRAENDALRGIATKIMPCHYCGATEIAKCPYGFPGCALADDIFGSEDSANEAVRQMRDRLRKIIAAPRETMSDAKAVVEMLRQARLALGEKA